jgi:hypothetical protein
MDDIKEKYEKIRDQIEILEGIKKDDKIYYSNGIMYLQSYTPLQSLYRTISGETRYLTFRYLEIFISDVIEMCNNVKRTIKYIQTPLTTSIVKDIPKIKKDITTILNVLLLTYPTNEKMINILINNISSC